MTEVWATIGVLAVVGAAIKATGPVLVGGRQLPAWANGVIALLAPALLSALVTTYAVMNGPSSHGHTVP